MANNLSFRFLLFGVCAIGELFELKEELNSLNKDKKKDAVKKVIASMTVGKDVSSLFPDVVNCAQTENLEVRKSSFCYTLTDRYRFRITSVSDNIFFFTAIVMQLKKLVYLYLINYAKSQPDLTIMAVNTFVKDTDDPNPLIRALAVRTMGCIRVEKITEYLCDPLAKCLKDDDPYVRKTAAICVAKLFDINGELVEDRQFLKVLTDMIADSNPMVVANAVAALSEIQEISGRPVFKINAQTLFKLLAALNECTEWGQVFILDSLAQYNAMDSRDAESIIERVLPRLQHANCAVVLGAVKVILKELELVQDQEKLRTYCKKMAPPLVTLLSAEAEIQYVALRNINLIVQKRPSILAHEIKVFFCKYNDPVYVKLEKLEIMIRLANDRNIDQVLLEFKEYATEVDVDFVRKAVRAIGRCAISLERCAERCINVLVELIQTKVNYVVQEAIVVIKDIFRRYPNRYESIISILCENLDTLDEPEAKASMIWIIGEYAERIDNAEELLEQFLESFPEESSLVQLQLLTSTVKLFLKKPQDGPQQMIQLILSNATQETDNPDLRDRAFIYWRLLSTDPEAAKRVVLAERPIIMDDTNTLEGSLLDELLQNMSTLASVYHKPASTFVQTIRPAVDGYDLEADEDDLSAAADSTAQPTQPKQPAMDDLLGGLGDLMTPATNGGAAASAAPAAPVNDLLGDLLSLDVSSTPAPPSNAAPQVMADPFGLGMLDSTAPAAPVAPPKPVLLTADKGKGLEICGSIVGMPGALSYDFVFRNRGSEMLSGFMIQFNKNSAGLVPNGQLSVPPLGPGAEASTILSLSKHESMKSAQPVSDVLQVAIKDNAGIFYYADRLPPAAFQ